MSRDIFAALRQIRQAGSLLELLNTFQGVPVVYAVTLQQVGEQEVHVHINGHEVICLTLEATTTLLSPVLEEPVRAHVLACDVRAGTAKLGLFQYASGRVGDRVIARVAPRANVEVRLVTSEQTLGGQLADVSIEGLGVYVSGPESFAGLRPRTALQAILTLPGIVEPLTFNGLLRSIKAEGSRQRLGIMFNQQTRPLGLQRYIRERQSEILGELRSLYNERIGNQ
jgi:hypothetical protein